MTSLNFTVDPTLCTQCDACAQDCPAHIIARSGSVPFIEASSEETCIHCQHCLAVCPAGAISIHGLTPKNSLPLSSHVLPSHEQMKTFVRGRRSVRQFRPENVPVALIDELLADIAHAPAGCNIRDLTFSVVDNRKDIERLLERVVTTIESEKNPNVPDFVRGAAEVYRKEKVDAFFRGAPHLLVVSPGTQALCGQEDTILALACFELLAQSAGVGTTWCGMMKLTADTVPGIRPLLGLEPNTYFYAMMFGLPAVRYARTVQRDTTATIRRIKL